MTGEEIVAHYGAAVHNLFYAYPEHAIDAVREIERGVGQILSYKINEDLPEFISDVLTNDITQAARVALRNPEQQSWTVGRMGRTSEIITYSLDIIQRYGIRVDIALLRGYTDDPDHGKSAVDGIKTIELRNN